MNQELFDSALKVIGYTNEQMQELLGISRTAFYRKRKGITQFTLKEIATMMTVLPEELCGDIFFNAKVS